MTGPLAVLVGPPGSGKSTIGRILASRLHVRFRDTDVDIAAAAGKSVSAIFVEDGEPAFRALEVAAVAAALAEFEGILSLGGGAVMHPGTRAALRAQHVVFLDIGLASAARRTGMNRDRPLLLANPRATLAKMLAERRPAYLEVADTVIPADASVTEVVGKALAAIKARQRRTSIPDHTAGDLGCADARRPGSPGRPDAVVERS